jgi:transcriptional regulator, araC family
MLFTENEFNTMRKNEKIQESGLNRSVAGKHEMRWSKNDQYISKRRETWNIHTRGAFPLYPFCMEEEIRVRKYWYAENFTRFMLIVLVLEGDILFRFEKKNVRLTENEILIVPKNTAYSFENGHSDVSRKVVLEIVGKNLTSDLDTFGLNRLLVLRSEHPDKLADQIRAIGDLLQGRKEPDIPVLLGMTYRFLAELSYLLPDKKRPDNLLQQAQMLLESDFGTKLTLSQLAEKLNCKEERINKIFKEKLGITPTQYRIEKKMELAKHLLVTTSQTVKEISFQLGYCDQFYFSSEFRRITGFSPKMTRRQKKLI